MKRAGLTLVEVLIAVALTGLLLALLSQVLVPGFQVWKQTQFTSEVEQNGLLAEKRLVEALLATTQDSVGAYESGDFHALSCLAHEGTLDDPGYEELQGETFWQSMTVFKLDRSEERLTNIRWVQPPLPSSEVFALSAGDLAGICSSGRKGRLVARRVRGLRRLTAPEDKFETLELELSGRSAQGSVTVTRTVTVQPRIQDLNS